MFYAAQYLETKRCMWALAFGIAKNRIFFLPV